MHNIFHAVCINLHEARAWCVDIHFGTIWQTACIVTPASGLKQTAGAVSE